MFTRNLITILFCASLAFGANISTNTKGGGACNSPSTWTGGVVPGSADTATVVFADTVTCAVDFPVGYLILNGTWTQTAGSIKPSIAGPLATMSGIEVCGSATLTLSGSLGSHVGLTAGGSYPVAIMGVTPYTGAPWTNCTDYSTSAPMVVNYAMFDSTCGSLSASVGCINPINGVNLTVTNSTFTGTTQPLLIGNGYVYATWSFQNNTFSGVITLSPYYGSIQNNGLGPYNLTIFGNTFKDPGSVSSGIYYSHYYGYGAVYNENFCSDSATQALYGYSTCANLGMPSNSNPFLPAIANYNSVGFVQASANGSWCAQSLGTRGYQTASTTSSASKGSNTITVAVGTGIASGNTVYAPGVFPGTTVTGVSGTTITLSQPTTAVIPAGTVTLFALPTVSSHSVSEGCQGWVSVLGTPFVTTDHTRTISATSFQTQSLSGGCQGGSYYTSEYDSSVSLTPAPAVGSQYIDNVTLCSVLHGTAIAGTPTALQYGTYYGEPGGFSSFLGTNMDSLYTGALANPDGSFGMLDQQVTPANTFAPTCTWGGGICNNNVPGPNAANPLSGNMQAYNPLTAVGNGWDNGSVVHGAAGSYSAYGDTGYPTTYVEPTRTIEEWDSLHGGPGTIENFATCLALSRTPLFALTGATCAGNYGTGDMLQNLWNYFDEGVKPLNLNVATGAHDGTFQGATSPVCLGCMM
jgi:hypothetical protein